MCRSLLLVLLVGCEAHPAESQWDAGPSTAVAACRAVVDLFCDRESECRAGQNREARRGLRDDCLASSQNECVNVVAVVAERYSACLSELRAVDCAQLFPPSPPAPAPIALPMSCLKLTIRTDGGAP